MTSETQRRRRLLVVGAGPVGLVAGLSAFQLGVDVAILDAGPERKQHGHATLLHPSSMRLLDELGVARHFVPAAQTLDRIAVYVDAQRVAAVALAAPALSVHQLTVEDALRFELAAKGVEVCRPCEATTISEKGDHVQVRVLRSELLSSQESDAEATWQPVSSSVVEADFLIGADGRDSRVRRALGIELVDLGSATSYAMFELPSREPPGSEIVLAFSEGLASAMIPLPGGRVRWGFELASRTTEKLYATDLSMLLARRAPWYGDAVQRLDWGAVVRFERRLARRFGRGRAWLAGDSAHGTSPFGAQSMNAGLLEARDLVSRIATSAMSSNHVAALEDYGSAQSSQWQKLLGFNVSFELLSHAPQALRAYVRGLVPALPASGRELDLLLGQLGLAVR